MGVELGERGGRLGRADALEYGVRLPEQGAGARGAPAGGGAAAQAASAWASSQELPMARERSSACWWRASASTGSPASRRSATVSFSTVTSPPRSPRSR